MRRSKEGCTTLLFSIPLPSGGGGGGGGEGEGELAPGQSATAVLWLHAPAAPGPWQFKLVWYCEPVVSFGGQSWSGQV